MQSQFEAELSAAELAAVLATRSEALQTLQVHSAFLTRTIALELLCMCLVQATCYESQQHLHAKNDEYQKVVKQLQGQSQVIKAVEHEMHSVRQEVYSIHKAVDCNRTKGDHYIYMPCVVLLCNGTAQTTSFRRIKIALNC